MMKRVVCPAVEGDTDGGMFVEEIIFADCSAEDTSTVSCAVDVAADVVVVNWPDVEFLVEIIPVVGTPDVDCSIMYAGIAGEGVVDWAVEGSALEDTAVVGISVVDATVVKTDIFSVELIYV